MGLIKAIANAAGSTMADQWKEFFYCDAIDSETLMVRGHKKTARSSNTSGNDNIISNGSIIAVADGQCMLIVDQGKVVELCAEPGEFVYDSSTEPSIFTGSLGQGIINTFKTIGKRFTFGGLAPKDQRVYYINIKELVDNKFGTPNPVPFRVVDNNIGLDVDITVRCNGVYSYKITDPILFYTNVCGNVSEAYSREQIASQLKSEFLSALQPAFARISEMGIRYSALPGHTMEMADAMNAVLTEKWNNLRGLSIVSVAINSITAPKEDEDMIKELQKTAVFRNPNMAAASLVGAQSEAMKNAASNPNGAMMGFAGLNMAQAAGGMNAQNLFAMGQQPQYQQPQQQPQQPQASTTQQPSLQKPANEWTCSCGTTNTSKFCCNCGQPKPQPKPSGQWTCSCGAVNSTKFCSECGAKMPVTAVYKCDKCGWTPDDPTKPPKFCPECGDIFDTNDIQS